MKQIKNNQNDLKHSMVILPADDYAELKQMLHRIESYFEINNDASKTLNGYISEKEAMKRLDRKATWFWQQRTNGKLPFRKLGSKVMYHEDDIANLLNEC